MEDSTTKTTRSSVKEKIDSFVEGDLERATEVFSELLEIASRDEDITAPANTSPAVSSSQFSFPPGFILKSLLRHQVPRVVSPEHWTAVRIVLIKSIREGVFFDRKYWARHSKAGDVLKPIYLSRACMDDKMQQLNKCASKPIGQCAGVLSVHSGQIRQGSKPPHERSRGGCER